MPQKTNLNINPYYDDFNVENNYHKVLFRPGRPVQARELTTLQSTFQNQVESFGRHIFKEGSMVIPGNITYDNEYFSVKLESDHLGIPISLYLNDLKGKKFKGQNSGVTIIILDYKLPSDSSDITDITIFVKYLTSDNDNSEGKLTNSESLISQETIVYGNTTIDIGDTVATLISSSATATGSSVGISSGVYFIRGNFVDVSDDRVVLDPYSNTPSYRVGFNVLESIVSSNEDPSLYDNAKGFSNYAAPGADRLKISTTLTKKSLTDFNDTSFIELLRVDNGEIKKIQNTSTYSIIDDYFALRTFEESGNYSLGNFKVEVANSLNDNISNEGIFQANQSTEEGGTPSDDLMCVRVSPGTAYVKGKRVDKPGTTIVDVEKPRDTETIDTVNVPFEMGTLLRVDNPQGSALINLDVSNGSNIVLHAERRALSTTNAGTGAEIGKARVYSYGLRNTPYTDASSQWNLYLYDIQTYTKLTFNDTLTSAQLPKSSYIRGKSSGATGYANVAASGTNTMNLVQTSGSFIVGEAIIINENEEVSRSINAITVYGIEDIRSVYQNVDSTLGIDFIADTVLVNKPLKGFSPTDTVDIDGSGNVTSAGNKFTGIKEGSVVRYQTGINTTSNYNKVSSVSPDGRTMVLGAIDTVTGIATGSIGIATNVSLSIATPQVVDTDNSGLYTPIEQSNISDVNLSGSKLAIVNQITNQSTDGNGTLTLNLPTGITSAYFDNFDTQKYSIHYNDGTTETLTKDQFDLQTGSNQVVFNGLSKLSQTNNVVVNATIEKNSIKRKNKEYKRSTQLTVDKTISGVSTVTNGLSQNNFYGLRIEDQEISLNVCDVAEVVAVYESKDGSNPTLDKLSFVSGLSLNTATVLGEKITGAESKAVAQIVNRDANGQDIEIVYLNSNTFTVGELITFEESGIVTTLQQITLGIYLNITDKFALDKGQKEQFYDYSRLVRKRNVSAPTRRLLVIYNHYTVPSDDTGDVFTVDSYTKERFINDVPTLANELRASDTLDFRPRVSEFTDIDKSPFSFTTRAFNGSGATSSLVVSPEGDSVIGYSYYLPRIDKLVLDPSGIFTVVKGVSSSNPKPPTTIDTGMHVATISLPPYLYDPNNIKISLVDNKRYTMRDIGKIEDRVENLEIVTTLSLLELDTKTLQIKDATGDRFKSGFFVDDFKDNKRMDIESPDNKMDIDSTNGEMIVPLDRYSFKPEPGLSGGYDLYTADFSQNLSLLDSNVQKTGDIVTLNYSEKSWIENTFASRVENVNPFEVILFRGRVTLNPASDNWTRTEIIEGDQRVVLGDEDRTVTDNIFTGSRPETHIRSRNVGFNASGLKPFTNYHTFFDGKSGIDIIPKLIEIAMTTGQFQVGETVEGFITGISTPGTRRISFRLAQPNHKTGTYNSPTTKYGTNPYNQSVTIPSAYSASSTILNVDIASLTEDAQGEFFGRITNGMKLIGVTSKAVAIISDVRLFADSVGDLNGSFFFRNPLANPVPPLTFTNGTKTFKLTSDSTNSTPTPGDDSISQAQTVYNTSGIVEEYELVTTVIRRPVPPPPVVITRIVERVVEVQVDDDDPLAQSFTVDETGAFLSSVDLYFFEKDPTEKITVQLRSTELGTPTNRIVQDFAQVELDPSQIEVNGESIIKTSTDGSVATNVKFPSPIYLEPGRMYAIVLLAPTSTKYKVWISRMGEPTVATRNLGEGSQSIVNSQYLGGSLYKSQNGTIWTASQEEDLKFTLYKCNFITNQASDLTLYNPRLSSKNLNFKSLPNSIKSYTKKLKVGITKTTHAPTIAKLVPGRKISAAASGAPAVATNPTGIIEKVGSEISGTIGVSNGGSGYKPSQTGAFTSVPLFNITGSGTGAQATVDTNAEGQVSSITVTAAGNGYSIGDVLGVTTSSLGNDKKGEGALLTVDAISGVDTLYLTNVKGQQFTASDYLVLYTLPTDENPVSAGTASTVITSLYNSEKLYEGDVIEVNHYNHGLTADNNKVTISGIEPNTVPVKLNAELAFNDTQISVADTTGFATFEGISTNRGYVKINQEIIFYDAIGTGTLSVGTRGYGGSAQDTHPNESQCSRYEFNGVSLTGINTTHDLPSDADLKALRTIDTYHIQVPRTGRENLQNRSTGTNQLSFSETGFAGGDEIFTTQNFQYDSFIPAFNILTPSNNVSITGQLRSVSGTSDGGSEASFIDQGYEDVEFNQLNKLSSPRLLCSEINESVRLTSLPKNKSITFVAQFKSSDSNLSPALDLSTGSFRLLRNRLDSPVSNYAKDGRVNQITGDPHAAVYISQKVNLKNPSTSLKVLVSAYRHSSADFRVLYRLFKPDSSEVDQSYRLFPGYDNLKDVDIEKQVVDSNLNNGKPDTFVSASRTDEFKDYEFTAWDNTEEFTGFQIKIECSGTNEAYPPKFKDFRTIALA